MPSWMLATASARNAAAERPPVVEGPPSVEERMEVVLSRRGPREGDVGAELRVEMEGREDEEVLRDRERERERDSESESESEGS